jgi:hypothetical protein
MPNNKRSLKRVKVKNSIGGMLRTMKLGSLVLVNGGELRVQFIGWNGRAAILSLKGDREKYTFQFEPPPEGCDVIKTYSDKSTEVVTTSKSPIKPK